MRENLLRLVCCCCCCVDCWLGWMKRIRRWKWWESGVKYEDHDFSSGVILNGSLRIIWTTTAVTTPQWDCFSQFIDQPTQTLNLDPLIWYNHNLISLYSWILVVLILIWSWDLLFLQEKKSGKNIDIEEEEEWRRWWKWKKIRCWPTTLNTMDIQSNG